MDRTYGLGLILAGIALTVVLPDSGMARAERGGTNRSFAVEAEPVPYAPGHRRRRMVVLTGEGGIPTIGRRHVSGTESL